MSQVSGVERRARRLLIRPGAVARGRGVAELSAGLGRIEHMFELPDSVDWSGDRPAGRSGAGAVMEVVTGFGHDSRRWVERVLVPAAVERLDEPPGELLAAAIEEVRAGLGEVSDGDVLRLVTAVERQAAWAQSVQVEAIAELSRRPSMNPNAREAPREALDGRSLTIAEVGAALGLTRYAAARRVDLAEQLAVSLPATLAALRQGRIDKARAEVIAGELADVPELPAGDRAAIEERALTGALDGALDGAARTTSQLREVIRRALLAVNPADAAERHERARRERCVRTAPLPDAMGELWARLPAETITSIETVLNGLADSAAAADRSDRRTHDQRRADVLGDIFATILDGEPLPRIGPSTTTTTAAAAGPGRPVPEESRPGTAVAVPEVEVPAAFRADPAAAPPDHGPGNVCSHPGPNCRTCGACGTCGVRGGFGGCGGFGVSGWWLAPPLPSRQRRRPHLVITIAASTLAGTDDQPATLAGYGPVPADLARRLAADAGTSQAACVDPDTGACQWIGTTTPYRPSQTILDQVIARDPTCRHPGCRQPAPRCDLDHVIRHPTGPTCACNLIPLCRTHHRCKHNGGWRVERPDSRSTTRPDPAGPPGTATRGTVIWTSPLGRRYPVTPTPLMPPAPQPPQPPTTKPPPTKPAPADPPF
jgi:hypothetical protein